MSRQATHDDPVWRERADFIIATAIDSASTDVTSEQLWTRKVDDFHFMLCCIPFFAFDLALGDIVRTEPDAGRRFMVAEVTQPSGRYVFRVFFGDSFHPRDEVADELASRGALLEWSSMNLLAVDARDHAHARELATFLQEQEDLGHLIYETGKSA